MIDKLQYSLEIYENYALISGPVSCEALVVLVQFCKLEGFTHMTFRPDGKQGFMLIKDKPK